MTRVCLLTHPSLKSEPLHQCIHHAVEKYGKVLFINSDHFIKPKGVEWAEEQLAQYGHIFMSFPDKTAYTIRIQVCRGSPTVTPPAATP